MAESGEERRQTSSTAQKQCIRNQHHPCEMEHFTHRNTGTQLTNGIRCEWHGKKKKKCHLVLNTKKTLLLLNLKDMILSKKNKKRLY